jgi:hypothetical protein
MIIENRTPARPLIRSSSPRLRGLSFACDQIRVANTTIEANVKVTEYGGYHPRVVGSTRLILGHWDTVDAEMSGKSPAITHGLGKNSSLL